MVAIPSLGFLSSKAVRRILWLLLFVSVLFLLLNIGLSPIANFFRLAKLSIGSKDEDTNQLPPLYERFHKAEDALSQHDLKHDSPDSPAYFYAANHFWGLGWNNFLEEQLFLAYLAWRSNRSYVFDDYTWFKDRNQPYSDYNGHLIPSRVPLSALISGPMVGRPFDAGDKMPLSVNLEFFEKRCSNPTRFKSDEVNSHLNQETPATVLLDKWVEKLASIEDKCVEIDAFSTQIFDFGFFGTKQVLGLWDAILASPILRRFAWSDLVLSAIPANQALGHIYPADKSPSSLPSLYGQLRPVKTNPSKGDLPSSFPGLLAMHVRRGDYEEHCQVLANWSSNYMGLSQHPGLPDRFVPPPGGGWGENTPENHEIYRKQCWPTIPEIVERVREVMAADESKGVDRLFVLTNGERGWVNNLKAALGEIEGMKQVTTSRDLELTWEQKFIAQAVDMAVAERAQIFIGIGWSSMTTNIILMRTARNQSLTTDRFW